jgi:hypothetical protein
MQLQDNNGTPFIQTMMLADLVLAAGNLDMMIHKFMIMEPN